MGIPEHLDAYMRRPDCFRDVASSIRSQCTNLETEQNERIQGNLPPMRAFYVSLNILSCYLVNPL